jgi:ribonuclease Z
MARMRDAYFPGTEELAENEMRIVALGTGRPFSRLAQANSGWLVELGNGDRFVFDFGFGSFSRFAALEIALGDITALFASHLHVDHVGDFAAYWVGARTGGRLERLQFVGPSGSVPEHGFQHFVDHQLASYEWDSRTRTGLLPIIGEKVDVTEFEWSAERVVYESNGVTVTSFPAVHIHDGAVGFRLDWNGRSLVYSGDTAPNRFLLEAAEGADVLIHESFNTPGQLVEKSGYDLKTAQGVGTWAHTHPVDAGRVFGLTRPGLAVAFHFNHDFDTGFEVGREIREHYDGPLALAQDLMVINVRETGITTRMGVASEHTWPQKEQHAGWGEAERGERPVMSPWLREARLTFDDSEADPAP